MTDQPIAGAMLKRCSKCREEKPATPEFFYRCTTAKDRLQNWCKGCEAAYCAAYYAANREAGIEKGRQYNAANREARAAYTRNWYRENRERALAAGKVGNERRRKSRVLWAARHRHFARAWWNHRCAYCGSDWQPTKEGVKVGSGFDHFQPLIQGGLTTPANMLPGCPACNFSKNDAEPRYWLGWKFGESLAAELLARIEAYFAAVQDKFGAEIEEALARWKAEQPAEDAEVAP